MMKKSPLLILILLSLLVSCKPKQHPIVIIPDAEKNHLQRNRLFGNIQQLTTTSYYISGDDSTKMEKELSTTIQYYSADGFLLKVATFDNNGRMLTTQTISYNHNAKEDFWIETDSNDLPINRCDYEYDANHYIAGEKVYHHDSLVYSCSYKTDGIGNIIEMQQNHIVHKLKNVIHYNEVGLVARIDEYDPHGKLFKYATIEYDNFGDEVNRRVFKGANNIIEYTYTQYDENGRLMKVIYEDRLHKLTETYHYSGHDNFANWTVEERNRANRDIYIRKRTIQYY